MANQQKSHRKRREEKRRDKQGNNIIMWRKRTTRLRFTSSRSSTSWINDVFFYDSVPSETWIIGRTKGPSIILGNDRRDIAYHPHNAGERSRRALKDYITGKMACLIRPFIRRATGPFHHVKREDGFCANPRRLPTEKSRIFSHCPLVAIVSPSQGPYRLHVTIIISW